MKPWRARILKLLALCLILAVLSGAYHSFKALPAGVSIQGRAAVTHDIAFIPDATWVDETGQRHVDQAIFDEVLRIIAAAQRLIVVDMFLFNDFQGPTAETTRAISDELTSALIARKRERPDIDIIVISDPVNTVYGGLPSPFFERLRAAGIPVAITDLRKLRDSNPAYSAFWRLFVKPFGNTEANTLPNPLGPGRVSLRSYLELVNFKANHRKVMVADSGDDFVGLVSSANPHDGSSAHSNVAIRFSGPAAIDILHAENAVLAFSGHTVVNLNNLELDRYAETPAHNPGATTVQVITENKIEDAVLGRLEAAGAGDTIRLMMFYLSDRNVVRALIEARSRGADLRILLDPNKDAFGREKNGVPNRPVADELTSANIDVRWCDTHGEQCHAKLLMVQGSEGNTVLISGSANFTRRNLNDLNLEMDVVVRGRSDRKPFPAALAYFDDAWSNTDARQYSVAYEVYEDDSWWHRILYRFMEASGISSF